MTYGKSKNNGAYSPLNSVASSLGDNAASSINTGPADGISHKLDFFAHSSCVSSGADVSAYVLSSASLGLLPGFRRNLLMYGGRHIAVAAIALAAAFASPDGAQAQINVADNETSTGISIGDDYDYSFMDVYGSAVNTGIYSGGTQIISNGGTASNTTISGGTQIISNGGTAINAIIETDGDQIVSSGGTANSTSIHSNGEQWVEGTANITTIYADGWQIVSNGGSAISATISGGTQIISNGGTAISAIIEVDGDQIVSSGGTASNTTINYDGWQIISNSGTADSAIISGGYQVIYAGGTANNTSINGGTQIISNGGTADNTSISDGGYQSIYAGGTASNTTINHNSWQYVYGTASNTSINSGWQIISNGGTASNTTINNGGRQDVYGTANNTSINSGWQIILNGGTASNTTINSGSQIISNGGTASNTTINGGSQIISNIHYDGWQHVLSDGSAVNTTINGGTQIISNGGTASDTYIYSGGSAVISGGISENNHIYDGQLSAYTDSALAGSVYLGSAGTMDIGATTQEISYIAAESGAAANISAGGKLSVNQDEDTLYAGAVNAADATVEKGGSGNIYIAGSGVSIGNLNITNGGVILGNYGNDASISANVDVSSGGLIGGYGSVSGDINISSGGTLAAGGTQSRTARSFTDYGNITVDGNLNVSEGGVFAVRTDQEGATSDTDTVTVNGTADFAPGSVVKHIAYTLNTQIADPSKEWVILTASSLNADNSSILTETNLLYLAPILSVSGNDMILSFRQNISFDAYGDTHNQKAVGGALTSVDASSELIATLLAGVTDNMDVNGIYDSLSGEIHASLAGGLIIMDRNFTAGILNRISAQNLTNISTQKQSAAISNNPHATKRSANNNLWYNIAYSHLEAKNDGNAGLYTLNGPEISLGYTYLPENGFLGGAAFQFADREMKINSRRSKANTNSFSFEAHGGYQAKAGAGTARFILGGMYTLHDIDTSRNIDISTSSQKLEASYHANSYQLFAEGAYLIPIKSVWIEPFANIAWTGMRTESFKEHGGFAALHSPAQNHENFTQMIGSRILALPSDILSIEAQMAWRHTYGRLQPRNSFIFAEGGQRFGIMGAKTNRNELAANLGASLNLLSGFVISAEAEAALGERSQNYGGGLLFTFKW